MRSYKMRIYLLIVLNEYAVLSYFWVQKSIVCEPSFAHFEL